MAYVCRKPIKQWSYKESIPEVNLAKVHLFSNYSYIDIVYENGYIRENNCKQYYFKLYLFPVNQLASSFPWFNYNVLRF